MIRIILAVLALVCAASIADARPRGLHADCNVTMPCEAAGLFAENAKNRRAKTGQLSKAVGAKYAHTQRSDKTVGFALLPENPAIQSAISAPARYIAGRLSCAKNVNAALSARGIRGTGSALARSFLTWGRASHPVPGAVAVYGRRGGGHVALVSRVEGGRVYVLNPSSRRQRWVETVYPRRALAYRVAS